MTNKFNLNYNKYFSTLIKNRKNYIRVGFRPSLHLKYKITRVQP